MYEDLRKEVNQDLLKKRYFQGGESTWVDVVNRVAAHAAKTKTEFSNFFDLIHDRRFLPSRMTYMGTDFPFASSCFVFDIEDNLESIMTTLKEACHVQKYGGGTGYDFSQLRPRGDIISTSKGEASGPVSFMKLYHNAMEVVNRAGKKHAAQMGILRCDHPDIFEFIHCKDAEGALWTFNISVAVTDAFMYSVKNDTKWDLVFDNKVYKTIKARDLWGEIVQHAWHNGDPGVIFIDTVNKYNRYPFPIRATNPCGEIPQPSHFACNLGSIDLSRHVTTDGFDIPKLEETVRQSVRFLDNSIENAYFPVEKIRQNTIEYRNIGIGVMGWADALITIGLPYDSREAVELGDQIMELINSFAEEESISTGNGNRRNVTLTAIAPTGSISMLADCSSGIEPLFGIVTTKNTYVGSYHNAHWLFEQIAKDRGFYSDDLMGRIAETGTVQTHDEVPDDVKALFKTTNEIDWQWHVMHQAAFQKHVEQSVSKTINMSNDATAEDVSNAYMMAYETECKSITVYRDGSRQVQVVDSKKQDRKTCPKCQAILFMDDGVMKCVSCGYVPASESVVVAPEKQPRPATLAGHTYKKQTPIGTAYITVNDSDGAPVEVFINVGKAGSEVSAVSEGLGRLCSLVLRLQSPIPSAERVDAIIDELIDIGGSRPLGFGPNRVRSLPDGVAQVLRTHMHGATEVGTEAQPTTRTLGDICPDCGEASFLNIEGCRKCLDCGYSEC